MRLLSGSALSLAAAFYGLGRVTSQYVDTLKQNSLYFGGQLKTLKAMRFAQEQLLKGATEFTGSDIMSGMRELMSAGIDAQKNFKFINDAASATGQTFQQMASNVHQAIAGNMSGLIQMGVITERGARTFDKYAANTVARQQAIMGFLKTNKNLQNAVNQNFKTITGQWRRVVEGVRMFAQAIMGDPRNPNSLYSQIRNLIQGIGDWMHKHSRGIKRAGAAIGAVLGWVVRQVAAFARFVGRQIGKVLDWVDKHLDDYRRRVFSMLIWLELWKVKLVGWMKEHKQVILGLVKAFLLFRGIKTIANIFNTLTGGIAGSLFKLRLFRRELEATSKANTVSGLTSMAGGAYYQAEKDPGFLMWLKKRGAGSRYSYYMRTKNEDKMLAMERLYRLQSRPGSKFVQTQGKTGFRAGWENLMYSFMPAWGLPKAKPGSAGALRQMGRGITSFIVAPFRTLWRLGGSFVGLLRQGFTWVSRVGLRLTGWGVLLYAAAGHFSKIVRIAKHLLSTVWGVAKAIGNLILKIPILGRVVKGVGKLFNAWYEGVGIILDKLGDFTEWMDRKVNPQKYKEIDAKKLQDQKMSSLFTQSGDFMISDRYQSMLNVLSQQNQRITDAESKYGVRTKAYQDIRKDAIGIMKESIKIYQQEVKGYFKNPNREKDMDKWFKMSGITKQQYEDWRKQFFDQIWLFGGPRPKIYGPADEQGNRDEIGDPFELYPELDYLRRPGKDTPKETLPYYDTENPLIPEDAYQLPGKGGGDRPTSSVKVEKGAITIVVQKGDNIDEEMLAKKVQKALYECQRNDKLKAGA